ncbi:MAG: hypothetical protein KBT03_10085 [Bacteroidales bacterium]|nr:hypothetical protein [Candidatus Scybalousia scybalohippi]
MECTYKIRINGQIKQFSSQELDCFLRTQIQEGKRKVDVSDLTFSLSPQENTLSKLQVITDKMKNVQTEFTIINEDGDQEIAYKVNGSIGGSKLCTTYGDPSDFKKPLITPMDDVAYKQRQLAEYRAQGMTDEKAYRLIENERKTWKQLTDMGTEVHALFESILDPSKTFKAKFMSQEQQDILTTHFNDWITSLKVKYGPNAKFLTEVPIISKAMDTIYAQDGITSVNGRIDLLVIDESGKAHIFDFKVSRKAIGDWKNMQNIPNSPYWHSTKKQAAAFQLAFYRQILKQYDIDCTSCSIVPVKMDLSYDDEKNIVNADAIYLQDDKIVEQAPNNRHFDIARRILPHKTLLDNVDLMKSVQEPMQKFCPNYAVETEIHRNEVSVENYMNDGKHYYIIPEDSKEREKGKYYIWNNYKVKDKKIYCETLDDVRREMEELVHAENEHRGNEMMEMANELANIIESEGDIENLNIDNRYKSDYCKRIFRKYVDGKWIFQNNPDFIAAGIFMFTKDGKMEIVSMHHNASLKEVNLGLGTSLLGASKRNNEVDEHKILKATHGNIDLIKVMCILNNLPENLKEFKVQKIASFNIWQQTGSEVFLDTLYDNFKLLCEQYNIPCNIEKRNFCSTLEGTISTVTDICEPYLANTIKNWSYGFSPDDITQGVPYLQERLEALLQLPEADKLHNAIRSGNWNFDDPIQLSYMLISRAINHLTDYEVYIEADPALWFGTKGGQFYTGAYVNSAQTSPSLNAQTMGRIMATAETHIRRKQLAMQNKITSVINKYYESKKRSALIGGEVRFFDNLFVRDENGKMDKSFKLKNPDTDSSLTREEKDFIKVFLEIVNNYKFHGNEEKIANAKLTGEYYEVPLAMGDTQTQMHNKGVVGAVKTKYTESLNFLKILPQQELEYSEHRKNRQVYNKYNLNAVSRANIINECGTESLETNLEKLLRDVIYSYSSEEVMKEYLPRIQGIKIALQYNNYMFGQKIDDISQYMDKYVDRNIYQKVIMDEHLQTAYKFLSTVKSVTTTMTLGMNFRSGIRELLQGVWVHISRTMSNAYGNDQFTKGDVAKAWGIILKDTAVNPNLTQLCDAINVEYGMANADPEQVQNLLSQARSGLMNFNSNTLFFANRFPDSFHRLGFLIAKMLHDGSWEAHSFKDDQLVYDFKKDKRFSLLNSSNVDKKSAAYRNQRGLYLAMIDQFNKEGFNLKDGDDLPRAYTIQESNSIKSFSELCFGHYDKSSQMLMKGMFFGGMLLQFRTFLSAKLEQWVLKPGTYNQGKYIFLKNKDGVRYVRIYTNDENGNPTYRIDLETNVKEGDVWVPCQDWQGRFIEGIAYTMWDCIKSLKDPAKFKEIWKDEAKRANIKLFLWDMVWMSIMMYIIKALLLDDKENMTPLKHFSSTALYQSFADGPITNVMSQFSDFNPPAWRIVSQVIDNTSEILTDDRTLFQHATNMFGALNDFKYMENAI